MVSMTNSPSSPEDILLRNIAETRGRLDAIEASWKIHRATSRAYTLELILDYGYSLNKASKLTGHERSTIRVWLAAAGIGPRE